jgi:hypothetical protein
VTNLPVERLFDEGTTGGVKMGDVGEFGVVASDVLFDPERPYIAGGGFKAVGLFLPLA